MKIIGVLGGMGPQATIDLYQKIIDLTPAKVDQEHIPVLIWSNPAIPDRTEAILRGGTDPTPALVHGARLLAAGGSECIAMPCNTAHRYALAIQESVSVPLINMIDETARAVVGAAMSGVKVGILATTGTLASNLYQPVLEKHGLISLTPDPEHQDVLMNAIFDANGIKAGFLDDHNQKRVLSVMEHLQAHGATAFIAGCTELPLVLNGLKLDGLFDPTEILARAAIRFAMR